MGLDIEQVFGRVAPRTEHTFASGVPPVTTREPPKEHEMAMIRVAPVKVQVRTDWLSGTPKEITWGEDRLPVTRLVAIRDERSAYPAITGPRTLFEVDTPGARLALTYLHRSKRWTIDGLDEMATAA